MPAGSATTSSSFIPHLLPAAVMAVFILTAIAYVPLARKILQRPVEWMSGILTIMLLTMVWLLFRKLIPADGALRSIGGCAFWILAVTLCGRWLSKGTWPRAIVLGVALYLVHLLISGGVFLVLGIGLLKWAGV